MKIINIITQELRNDVSKAELELESCLQNSDSDVSSKLENIKPKIRNWREAIEDFKYWDSFVAERITPPTPIEEEVDKKTTKKKKNE
jgi:hypothetical protein